MLVIRPRVQTADYLPLIVGYGGFLLLSFIFVFSFFRSGLLTNNPALYVIGTLLLYPFIALVLYTFTWHIKFNFKDKKVTFKRIFTSETFGPDDIKEWGSRDATYLSGKMLNKHTAHFFECTTIKGHRYVFPVTLAPQEFQANIKKIIDRTEPVAYPTKNFTTLTDLFSPTYVYPYLIP